MTGGRCLLWITGSAHKHGVPDDDIHHALRNLMRAVEVDDDLLMVVGPAIDGTMLEICIVDPDGAPRAIHAMRCRAKFLPGTTRRHG